MSSSFAGVILSRIKEYRSLFAFVCACVCCMGIELGEGVISEIRLTLSICCTALRPPPFVRESVLSFYFYFREQLARDP